MSALDNPNVGNARSWRYRCPNGHTSWRHRTTKPGIYCTTCSQRHQYIIDAKTGEEVAK